MTIFPIVRTEFAARMKKRMFDFCMSANAPEIGLTEQEWWELFYSWNEKQNAVEGPAYKAMDQFSICTEEIRMLGV